MTTAAQHRIGLRLKLDSGVCSIPLHRVHHLAGFATLTGEPDDYFLGWLRFHGERAPVFDLNRVVCDAPTAESFGSRIILLEAAAGAATRYIGLLAAGVTDTAADLPELELDDYLPMLYTLIPEPPAEDA
ncbi:hypothetical protein [Granulicella rosea]|uniref:hypothetical protein n=1 Tax=Granulicella rosea TaxID=474952 RepID=UPI000B795306|nr:hypothetical protein [Granulicella rosea]